MLKLSKVHMLRHPNLCESNNISIVVVVRGLEKVYV